MPKPSKKFIGAIASFVFSASIYFGQRWAEMSGIISPSSTPILTIVTACIGGGLLLWNYWPDIVKHKLASTTNIDKTISVADYTLDILHEMKYWTMS